MKNQYLRMQKLAGLLTENYSPEELSDEISLDDSAIESDLPTNLEGKMSNKMSKAQFKAKIKEIIQQENLSKESTELIDEAKKEETEISDVDIPQPGDTSVDTNNDGIPDIDAGSSEVKKAFSDLTDAFQAAKALGDEKLIRQIANTITYFNKSIILNPR